MLRSRDAVASIRCAILSRRLTLFALLIVGCAPYGGRSATEAVEAESSTRQVLRGLPRSDATSRPIDPAIQRIREEGLLRSQVMRHADYLCNVIGPRLTGSQRARDANEWTRSQLEAWGLTDARLEPWGPFGREWNVRSFSLQTLGSDAHPLIGYPNAWSPGLSRIQTADVVLLDADEPSLDRHRGTLKGKIVLIGRPRIVQAHAMPLSRRRDAAELDRLARAPARAASGDQRSTESSADRRARFAASGIAGERLMSATAPSTRPTTRPTTGVIDVPATRPGSRPDSFTRRAIELATEEGALLALLPSTTGDGGTFFVTNVILPSRDLTRDPAEIPQTEPSAAPSTATTEPGASQPTSRPAAYAVDAWPVVPQATLAIEDFNRLARRLRQGVSVTLRAEMEVEFSTGIAETYNTVAEIPGTERPDEIVLLGAHLDSWHSGTGATDNAAGVATVMEAVRILRALNLQPRRTIRVGLWTGEEQGLLGSAAYVKQHLRRTPTSASAPATRLSPSSGAGDDAFMAYYNLDNGTGKIRGIYAQGNTAAAGLFRQWLAAFQDLDASTVTLADTPGTDHISFDKAGLPGFQFIQDPIEYDSRTHHANMDVYDRLQADDLKQAATILAAFAWETANMPVPFPRKGTW